VGGADVVDDVGTAHSDTLVDNCSGIQLSRIHLGHNRIRDQQPNYPLTGNDRATVADDSDGVNSRRWIPQRP